MHALVLLFLFSAPAALSVLGVPADDPDKWTQAVADVFLVQTIRSVHVHGGDAATVDESAFQEQEDPGDDGDLDFWPLGRPVEGENVESQYRTAGGDLSSVASESAFCTNYDSLAREVLMPLGLVIGSCSDPDAVVYCSDDFYGPELRLLCASACGTCRSSSCVDDDLALQLVLGHKGIPVSGCGDDDIILHCGDPSFGEIVQIACPTGCNTAPCQTPAPSSTGAPTPAPPTPQPTTTTAAAPPPTEEPAGGAAAEPPSPALPPEPLSTATESTTSAPTPQPPSSSTAAPGGGVVAEITQARVWGDPHVENLAGRRFDINQQAEHTLLRVPRSTGERAMVEVRAKVDADELDPCSMYMRTVSLRGGLLDNMTVEVRPVKRNRAGTNEAGNLTLWPFSMRVSTKAAVGQWQAFEDLLGAGSFMGQAAVKAVQKTRRTKRGRELPQWQRLDFQIGPARPPATIRVQQGKHQSLNVELAHMAGLGHSQIGGLLGTDAHNKAVEEVTSECKAARASKKSLLVGAVNQGGSWLKASWV